VAVEPSNLAVRLSTAFVGIPVILSLLYLAPPWAFYLLVLAVALVGVHELFAMTHERDPISQAVGVVVSAVASITVYLRSDDPGAVLGVAVTVPLAALLFTVARPGPVETAGLRAFALAAGPLLIVVPLTLLAVMRRTQRGTGADAVLLALGLAWLADTAGYFAGRFMGRRKLYEAISPKKTVEGAIGGLVASVVWALLGALVFLRGALPLSHALALGIVAGALGQAGDLGESLLKRSTGVKDSGSMVPGHGGVLDRVDALLMTTAVVFFYARARGWR
jgi:phosphatidate cytidylyltransferase